MGIETVMVRAKTVKNVREMDAPGKGKNDSLDSKIIAVCLRDDRYEEIRKNRKEYLILKRLTRTRDDLTKSLVQIKNKMNAWIDINNPVYPIIFGNLNKVTGMALLRTYSTPHSIIGVSFDKVIKDIKKHSTIPDRKKVELYIGECEIYCKYIKNSEEYALKELEIYLRNYDFIKEEMERLDKEIIDLARIVTPNFNYVDEIKGIAMISVISIIAEMGDVSDFKTARELLAFMGLSIKEKSSGMYQSESKISKAGSRRIRKHLYNVVKLLVVHNNDFRIVFCYYKSYKRDKHKKNMAMLIATACKFIRVLYGIIKNNEKLDTEKLLKGLDFSKCDMGTFAEEMNGKLKNIETDEEIDKLFNQK